MRRVAQARPNPRRIKPVADVKQLMNAMIDPQADEIWDATGWIITAAGEEERKPKNDEEWLAVMHHAVTVTEAGNLLMMAPRAKDGDLWMKHSQELIDAGQTGLARGRVEGRAEAVRHRRRPVRSLPALPRRVHRRDQERASSADVRVRSP